MIIQLQNISKKFNEKELYKNFDLSVHKNDAITILGANGSGKTTLIKIISGLIAPDTGTILIHGKCILQTRVFLMQKLGVFLEGHRSLFWKLSALENLMYFAGLKGIFNKEAKKRALELLEDFNLSSAKDNAVETFSKGMQQKLALACTLINAPSILLLDEPMVNLDQETKKFLTSFLTAWVKKNDHTLIASSHDPLFIEAISTKKIFI